jgi:hypothetical protein
MDDVGVRTPEINALRAALTRATVLPDPCFHALPAMKIDPATSGLVLATRAMRGSLGCTFTGPGQAPHPSGVREP